LPSPQGSFERLLVDNDASRSSSGSSPLAVGEHALAGERDLLGVHRHRLDIVEFDQSVDRAERRITEPDLHHPQRLDQGTAGDDGLVLEQQVVKAPRPRARH